MRIGSVTSTERFVGPASRPLQVVRATLEGRGAGTLHVAGIGLSTPEPVSVDADDALDVEVAVDVTGVPVATRVDAVAVLDDGATHEQRRPFGFVVAEPGWRMFLVPHFHYDPVWWNTQAFYTETWEKLPREERPWEGRRQQPAFTLIDAHLDAARRDPDYRFVLAELDYLKPYWDTFPWRRDELRELMAQGRLELMGGTYNEPNTNLTSAESTARNAVYGIGYQRDVLGGAPATAWQLDVFGHDPQFPGMMADAGLTSSSWARGPFHQWGPSRSPGGNPAMQFTSEFDWVSPSGTSLLTSYMPNHYSAGWDLDKAADVEEALDRAEQLFHELKQVAATRNVLLPVGSDYTPPNQWATEIQRTWNARYTWPRFEVALPRTFFEAVRAELVERQGASPQTRDMNPIYSGKDVSYIDTKQAQRVGENLLTAAERFGTIAALFGAGYPTLATDKAWRQLLFGAHHDGITGTESDQVYLDLLGGWRDTYELARDALAGALDHLGAMIDAGSGEGLPVAVFNGLSWSRTDVVRERLDLTSLRSAGLTLVDDHGEPVPFVLESPERDDAGRLSAATLLFVARDVPSVGYRTYRLVPVDALPAGTTWEAVVGTRIRNETFEVEVDPARGGAVSAWIDRRDGTSLLRPDGLANEVLAYTEYPQHPDHGEGPWHLTPTGEVESSADRPAAEVVVERSAVGERLRVRSSVRGCELTQQIGLYRDVERVVCTTDLDGFDDHDILFRLRVAADVPGGLPVSEVGDAVVGRGPGFPDVDVAEVPYTLDNPAYNWFGVGSTARIELSSDDGDELQAARAIGVAEVVGADDGGDLALVRALVVALVRSGVTSTASRGSGPRYGSIDTDSNLPDVRIAVGGPDANSFTRAVLTAAGPDHLAEFQRQLATAGTALVYVPASRPLHEVWRPNADLRGVRDLPVLVVAGRDDASTATLVDGLAAALGERSTVHVRQPSHLHAGEGRVADRTVGLVNVGLPGFNVDVHGTLHLSLMRSCSGWPSGVWLDPPRRTVPDGSSFQYQHWTHRFEYALVAGAGDWRAARFVRAGHEHNEPLRTRPITGAAGGLPPTASFLQVDGDPLVVTTIKPAGNPMARMAEASQDPAAGIVVRAYEPNGRRADARLRWFRPVVEAGRADLLEHPRTGLPVEDGEVPLRLDPCEIATVRLRLDPPPSGDGPQLGWRREPAQPVFGDYWLHNKGAAPIGYQPVTARIVERAVRADGPFDLEVAVASQRTDTEVAGTLELLAPHGWAIEPARRGYHLAPGAYERIRVRVTPAEDAVAGRWFVAVHLTDEVGQVHEDVVTVDLDDGAVGVDAAVASEERRVLHLERATRRAAVVTRPIDPATTAAIGGELSADLVESQVRVGVGDHGQLTVRLRNHVAGTIRGEAQLLSPWGTWDVTAPWTCGFSVAGGQSTTIAFDVCCPPDLPPTTSWALVKVMYLGRLLYTPSVPLVLGRAEGPP